MFQLASFKLAHEMRLIARPVGAEEAWAVILLTARSGDPG